MNDTTEETTADEAERLIEAARDSITDDMVSRLSATGADALDLLDRINRSGLANAIPALAEMVDNGDLDRIAKLARVYGAAEDSVTDDMISRLAETAGGGMDLLDKVNRSGVDQALPVLSEMINNGDLQRLAQLARVYGAAEDAVTDDMVGRMSEVLGGALELADQANRAQIGRALPVLAKMIDSGDLQRLADMARILGAAEDAVTDDMVGRLAEVFGEAVSLVDRLNRSGVSRLVTVLERLDESGGLDRIADSMPKMAEQIELLEDMSGCLSTATEEIRQQPPARGGIGGLLKIMRDKDNQEFLRFAMALGRQMSQRCLNRERG
jgi:uncharacterized protein YjgD (DUF1641 family)